MLDSSESLFLVLAFLVPGFIFNSSFSVFFAVKRIDTQTTILRLLTFTCLNYAAWAWLLYLIVQPDFGRNHTIFVPFAWFFILFLSPVLFGGLMGLAYQKGFPTNALRKLGFAPLLPDLSAWNYKFTRIDEPTNVIVTLNHSEQIAGRFWTNSLAAVSEEGGDLYLEEAFIFNEAEERWESKAGSDGVWISGDSIQNIEFWIHYEEKRDGQEE